MLQRMIAHGATIFLTSHVLEIVERLCTHVGIINNGKLVAQGPLDELRSGVPVGSAVASGGKMTLEQFFLQTVGGSRNPAQELSWLG
jgi:ABC-2 type transport system ATP-binding protein